MCEQKRPNFILLFPDQWRGDCLGCVGHPYVKTPYLDHIAKEGVCYTNAYTQAPSCIPARACLATGLNPNHNGRVGYEDCVPWTYRDSMMEQLNSSGYQTMQAGKTHFFPQRAHVGFEEMRLYEIPKYDDVFESDYHTWLAKETHGKIEDTARTVEPNSWVVNPWPYDPTLHNTHWIADSAIELLQRQDTSRPFFLQVGFHRPHAPYDPPISYFNEFKDLDLPDIPADNWSEAYNKPIASLTSFSGRMKKDDLDNMRKAYFAQIRFIDFEIGRIYNWLKKKKLLDNTYLIFTSDHGEMLGDHYLLRKIKPFEGATHIPFIIRAPKGENGNAVSDMPVTHTDIMATVLELAGITPKYHLDGISLVPSLHHPETMDREYIHGEHSHGIDGWQYVTNGHEKYAWETMSGKEYYFDLDKDPQELHNAISDAQYQGNIEKLRNFLIAELSTRPQDGLVENGKLKSGKVLPNYRFL